MANLKIDIKETQDTIDAVYLKLWKINENRAKELKHEESEGPGDTQISQEIETSSEDASKTPQILKAEAIKAL